MKILISPVEKVCNPNTGEELGVRACDIVETPFEVHEGLIWVDCPEGVDSHTHYYNMETGTFHLTPVLERSVPVNLDQPQTQGAQTL